MEVPGADSLNAISAEEPTGTDDLPGRCPGRAVPRARRPPAVPATMILQVTVSLHSLTSDRRPRTSTVDLIKPHEQALTEFPNPALPSNERPTPVELELTDAAGHRWRRTPSGRLVKLNGLSSIFHR